MAYRIVDRGQTTFLPPSVEDYISSDDQARAYDTFVEALKKVLKQCVRMCIKLELIEGNALFIDGSGIRANAGITGTLSVVNGIPMI